MRHERALRGISWHRGGWQAKVTVNKIVHYKRFCRGTLPAVIQAWRQSVQERHGRAGIVIRRFPPRLEGAICYLYVIKAGDRCKIGRTTDIDRRLMALQTGSPDALDVIALAPIHPSFEALIHERFKAEHLHGEWFTLSLDIQEFVVHLRAHGNPLTFLFPATVIAGNSRVTFASRSWCNSV